eukprot:14976805-Alexandrium_andersonii.AAC.1
MTCLLLHVGRWPILRGAPSAHGARAAASDEDGSEREGEPASPDQGALQEVSRGARTRSSAR